MDKGSRRRGIRIKLKFITFIYNSENPLIIGYLSPVVVEEPESGGAGGINVSLDRESFWMTCWIF